MAAEVWGWQSSYFYSAEELFGRCDVEAKARRRRCLALLVTAKIRPPENHCGSNFGVPNLLEIYRRANRQYR
jgi:hypothetical protein